MSKLIVEMEMPKSCWICEIGPSDQVLSCPFYNLSGEEQLKEEYKTGRHPDCPIGELVMCGECKYYKDGMCYNPNTYDDEKTCGNTTADWFCADGKRKDGERKDDEQIH